MKLTQVKATMAGIVWKVLVKVGEEVTEGQELIMIESMKMEIPIISEEDGVVRSIFVNEGDFINEGDPLIEVIE